MAPTIAIPPSSNYQLNHNNNININTSKEKEKKEDGDGNGNGNGESEIIIIKKMNEELGRELIESRKREEMMRKQLEVVIQRLRIAEEAEEMLASQLGELEVEAVEQARHYHAHISSLMDQLSVSQSRSSSSSSIYS